MPEEKLSPRVLGAIIATGLMSFCGVIIETAMNITFPTLMKEFAVGTATVQWMTTLYLLVVASIVPLSATLKRRFKTRDLFLVAISCFILGVVLDAVAPTFSVLLIGRGIQGVGTGIALPLMFNIILDQVPAPMIGMMMGVGTLITGVAPAIGPTFGGLVVTVMSWRYVFVFLLPLLVLALVFGVRCIQQKSPLSAATVDAPSVALIVLVFCGLIWGIAELASRFSWLALVIGGVALAVFCLRALRLKQPVIDVRLLANQRFAAHVAVFLLYQIEALGLSFLLPNYLQLVNGKTALEAGLIVLPGAALGALLAPLSGRLYDHVGAKMPLLLGSVLGLLSLAGFATLGKALTAAGVAGLYLLFMAGIGLSMGNVMTDGLHQLAPVEQPDGNAIFNTLQQFGAALGTSLAAALVAAGQAGATSRVVGTAVGSQHAFVLLAVLGVFALVILLVLFRGNKVGVASR
ncbi:MFS transporter [Lacticaseibacillus yichunensis]|uniref:MFS transporter n=1 Tax=Lacticaseibacillus yichunensis TaxID=2486015 RepID=A0ABW4CSC7_9LACO|nr:MFS transporter [Lacticaseibacillus yichunensis]